MKTPLLALGLSLVLLACADGGDISTTVHHRHPTQGAGSPGTDPGQPDPTDVVEPGDTTDPSDTTGPSDTSDTTEPDDTTDPTDTTEPDDTDITDPGPLVPVGPPNMNAGFIGGACQGHGDCNYNNGVCKTDAQGWPSGMCTTPCTSVCPDQTGHTVTFCVDGDAIGDTPGGLCLQKCDMARSPSGCREGYSCTDERRISNQNVSSWTCAPGELDGCLQQLMALGVEFTLPSTTTYETTNAGSVCSIDEPLSIPATINGVNFRYASFDANPTTLYLQCPVALALYETTELIKPRGVTDVVHLGVYNCRNIAGSNNLSQHAHANAIDIAGVQLNNGARYMLLDDWELGNSNPQTDGGAFLYWMAHAMHAEQIWNVILTPEYNAAHANHFHVDLSPTGRYFIE